MQIVTDAGADLTPEQAEGLDYRSVPLVFTLEGVSYRSGIDVLPDQFYEMLAAAHSYPTTSQPAPGEFATLYRQAAAEGDPEILSIHISSGLSGTLESAQLGAKQVPEARVTFFDSLTLSGAEGWLVEAAGRLNQAGWPLERILPVLERIRQNAETYYTLETLKYLEHGGRISHVQALLGQILDFKPIIGVDKTHGKYVMNSRERSLKRAIRKLAEVMAARFGVAEPMRLQVLHGHNASGAADLVQQLKGMFTGHFSPTGVIAPVLGAHTGPGLVGIVGAPLSVFADVPGIV
jgi:DegV family protein with EDD domain